MKKSKLFRGLTGTFALLTALCSYAGILAFENSGQVDIFLGITKPNTQSSDYSSVEEMRKAERLNEIQTQAEGSVLLFNNNNALPIAASSKMTLLGRTSADNIFKGGSGGSTTTEETGAVSLYQALKNEGYSINDNVYNALKNSTVKRSRGFIGEVGKDFYDDGMKSSFSQYDDVALITLGRYSGEQQDFASNGDANQDNGADENGDPIDNQGVRMLSLHREERETIELAKASGFKKIVVLLNTATTMEVGELESLGVDACLWIGYPGYTGFEGVAKVLKGEYDPSGRTVDTYATNSLSSPAMRNFGSFNYSNVTDAGQNKYLVYAEDIYIGYKYYETRYFDQVQEKNNAKNTIGSYASNGAWNYADEISYPFGYGISYAKFEEKMESIQWDRDRHVVEAKIKVTNLGSDNYFGESKDVVELYASLPYTTGNAEKSAIQLIGYGKTKNLKANESETITITADDYLFATYDNKAVNGADSTKKGCYVFDPGDYYFSIGKDCHDALNNVMALQGISGLFDQDGQIVTGNKQNAVRTTLSSLDNITYAKSPDTGNIVSNQFDDMDINYFMKDTVTYLTRSDWNTYPSRIENLTVNDQIKTILEGHTYVKPSDAPDVTSYKYSQKYETPITLKDMRNVPYEDDEKWDKFIDQLTPTQLAKICGEKFGNDAIEELGVPQTAAADGPDGIQSNVGFSHVSEVVATSTFNDELIALRGKFLAEDGMAVGQNGVYGFGANMHRTPYAGRNFEYYSEDTILSYLAGAIQTKAATEKGLTTYVKHFCANDQETWRNGNSTIMTEQTYRQGPLKGFEGSFTKGGSLGTMTSNARVGFKVVSMDQATMTQVLRNEWGFKGVAMTDSSKGSRYYLYTNESIEAGIDQFNNDETRGTSDLKNALIKNKDGHLWGKARTIAKHYFYTISRNFAMAGDDVVIDTNASWWETGIISVISVIGSLTAIFLALDVTFEVLDNRKKKEM